VNRKNPAGVKKERFYEIDVLRGCAIVSMVIYHLLYDLSAFGNLKIELYRGGWLYFQRYIAISFLTLSGISLYLSFERIKQKTGSVRIFRLIRRGAIIFLWGMVISAVTYLFLDGAYVRFGILHCIGASIIIGSFLLRFRALTLPLGVTLIALGWWLYGKAFPFGYLLWLGFKPYRFYTVDYFPLLPWLGVFLLGVFLGTILYPGYRRRFQFRDYSRFPLFSGLGFLGRHSLTIYLLHQPVILALLFALGVLKPPGL
jgi:uncharacterized membrane protein